MNRAKTFRAALSGFAVTIFFHLVYHFAFSKKSEPFNATAFSFEVGLLIVLGIAVFKVSKDRN